MATLAPKSAAQQLLNCRNFARDGMPGLHRGRGSLGQASCCFVGELPGLAALDGLGAKAGPAAVLGVDVLRTRPRMVYQAGRVLL